MTSAKRPRGVGGAASGRRSRVAASEGRRPAVTPALQGPHNSFFLYTFGQKEHAVGLLRALLPLELVRRLRWDSLTREPVSFVDARLRWLHSDLLFSVRALETDEEVLIYLLIEHQSTPHPLMAYRVLRYATRAWDDHLRKRRGRVRLPLLVPAVLYNGREPWGAARTLRELIDAPAALMAAAGKHVPQCGYLLIDLVHRRDADQVVDEMLTAFGRVALWAMEVAGEDERVVEGLARMGDVLAEVLAQPDGPGALGVLLRYILATHEQIDRKRLTRALVEAIDAGAGESVVTVYEQLIEQGRKKGRAEGREKGRAEGRATMLLDQLAVKFGPLPAEVKDRIERAGADELADWGRRVLTAASLEEALPPAPSPSRPVRRAPARR